MENQIGDEIKEDYDIKPERKTPKPMQRVKIQSLSKKELPPKCKPTTVKTRMVKKEDFDTVLLTPREKASLRSQYSEAITTTKRENICIKNP